MPPSIPRDDADKVSPAADSQRPPSTDPVDHRPMEHMGIASPSQSLVAEDETQYPTGMKFALLLFSLGLVLVFQGLDSNIVAVAVPSLTAHFHSIRDIGWYSAAYRLCSCSFQFTFGRMYKLFNVKRVFLASIAIYILGSTISAVAPTSVAFIAGRAVCGLGCAGIIAGAFTILRLSMPLRKRTMYAGIFAGIEGIAVIAGPTLGGVLVEKLSWRWCFYITLPIGAVTLVAVAFCLQDMRPSSQLSLKQKLKELDIPGTAFFFPSNAALFMALTWAGTRFQWNSPVIISLFAIFIVLLAVFAIDQWLKQDGAILPSRLLKKRSVLAGALFSFCCNGACNVFEYYLPTYLQAVKGYSPAASGYLLLPFIIGSLVAFLIQGAVVNAIGYFVPAMLLGSTLMPISAGLMTTLTVQDDLVKFLCYSAFLGFAGGIGFQAPQVAVQNTLPEADSHSGLAVILFAQSFGPAISIAAAQTIFTNRLGKNLHEIVPSLNSTKIENMGLTDLTTRVAPSKVNDVLKSLDESLTQTWYLGVAAACITMIGSASMEWKNIRQKRN